VKAFELHPEEVFDSLKLVDRPRPTIGPGDIRVRVRAVSLNYRDLMVARGSKQRAKRIVPLSDGAGEVIEIGSDVKRLTIGDRVAAAFFPTWLDGSLAEERHANALGGSLDGMLAEEVVLPERAWVKIPARYSFEQGSTLPCAGVTAWHALFGGRMSLLGILAGTQGPVNTYAIFHKNIRIRGVYVGSVAMFERLVRVLECSTIEPVIDRVFPFEETRAAYEHLSSGAHFGKVVIRLAP
jgi:NADPH:quinone reductase-like Zn-dependent oxidoreductase